MKTVGGKSMSVIVIAAGLALCATLCQISRKEAMPMESLLGLMTVIGLCLSCFMAGYTIGSKTKK